jgi:hypothetical protein
MKEQNSRLENQGVCPNYLTTYNQVLRVEYLKRRLMEIQLEQDGKSNLVVDEELDLSRVNWNKLTCT